MAIKAGDTVDVAGMDYILWGPGRRGGEWAAKRVMPLLGSGKTVWAFIRQSGGRWKVVAQAADLDSYKAQVEQKYQRTGEQLKEEGTLLALSSDSGAAFKDRATDFVTRLIPGVAFTSEDIIEAVGLPTGGVGANRNNSVGATVRNLAKAGLIAPRGDYERAKRPSSHGAALAVWIRTAKGAPDAHRTGSNSHPDIPATPTVIDCTDDGYDSTLGDNVVDFPQVAGGYE